MRRIRVRRLHPFAGPTHKSISGIGRRRHGRRGALVKPSSAGRRSTLVRVRLQRQEYLRRKARRVGRCLSRRCEHAGIGVNAVLPAAEQILRSHLIAVWRHETNRATCAWGPLQRLRRTIAARLAAGACDRERLPLQIRGDRHLNVGM